MTIDGEVKARAAETANPNLPTGEIEVYARGVTVQSRAEELPLPVAGEQEYPEDIRLKYRFLDLRRETMHRNIMLRCKVIACLRRRMIEQGFTEFQTPILSASSPEGARDYLVPSRLHPGHFYALPQAPQMFKQLLMVAGFDRYFQIAPCFRDEDLRADRSPGILPARLRDELRHAGRRVRRDRAGARRRVRGIRRTASSVTPGRPFPRIPYGESMLKYGTDKPDLRNPLVITDVSHHFTKIAASACSRRSSDRGGVVRAIPAPGTAEKSRKFFDDMNEWARKEGFAGLGYVTRKGGEFGGPIAKNHGTEGMDRLYAELGLGADDGLFFAAGKASEAAKLAGARAHPRGRGAGADRAGLLQVLLDRRFPDVRVRRGDRRRSTSATTRSRMPQGELEALETRTR